MSSSHPIISVIVPVYNIEQYVVQCIESVLNQSYQDFELIVVDDGSTDGGSLVCDQMAELDDRVRVLHVPNGGLSRARNIGIEASKGDYLFFLDGDDYLGPNHLLTLVTACDSKNYDYVVIGYTIVDEQGGFVRSREYEPREELDLSDITRLLLADKLAPSAWSKLYKKSVFGNMRFREGKCFEDVYFHADLVLQQISASCAIVKGSEYFYRKRRGSIMSTFHADRERDLVESWDELKVAVNTQYESLGKLAQFRSLWSYFLLLDRIVMAHAECETPYYQSIVGHLRGNVRQILEIPDFGYARKVAAMALFVSPKLYGIMVKTALKNDVL